MGWTALKNGKLLALASAHFDVFVTVDRNLSFQQDIVSFPIAFVVLQARTNRLADLSWNFLAFEGPLLVAGRASTDPWASGRKMIEVTLAAKPYPIRDTRFNHPDIATTAGLDPTTVAYCVKAFNDITTVLRDRGVIGSDQNAS